MSSLHHDCKIPIDFHHCKACFSRTRKKNADYVLNTNSIGSNVGHAIMFKEIEHVAPIVFAKCKQHTIQMLCVIRRGEILHIILFLRSK
jgi:hypothetical protein